MGQKGAKKGQPAATANNNKSTLKQSAAPAPSAKDFQTISGAGTVGNHPLANNPFFKDAIDRLSPNLINLIEIPGKLELKPYFKQALVKKTPFEGC